MLRLSSRCGPFGILLIVAASYIDERISAVERTNGLEPLKFRKFVHDEIFGKDDEEIPK